MGGMGPQGLDWCYLEEFELGDPNHPAPPVVARATFFSHLMSPLSFDCTNINETVLPD